MAWKREAKQTCHVFSSRWSRFGPTRPVLFVSLPASELHRLLRPFLLRRVKAEVASELPRKTEVVLYHGLSALQKRYYKAVLMKDLGNQQPPVRLSEDATHAGR